MSENQHQEELDLFYQKMELVRGQVIYYREHELFTWQWWFLIALTIVPWLLWFLVRRKDIQARLLLGGLFSALIALVLDLIGSQFGVWRYGIKAVPSVPPLIPYDLTLIPVTYMLVRQYCKSDAVFVRGTLVLSAGAAFVFEPILEYINVYHSHYWEHYFSFPIYFLIYMSANKISSISGWNAYNRRSGSLQ
ncbi:CBO0543 family protein [Paenibacillus turpanensis]|uniref:CBO0543 family protein n=1 Tax=Paenibacillus turpanensis TaxID=2689078 RepID=UPI00140E2228|nr:CBO0543 family protein [Paenibacillus turpanensis]